MTNFSTYASNWFSTYKQDTVRHTTKSEYQTILNKHLYPYFGEMAIEDIRTGTIQKFLNAMTGLTTKTATEILKVLRMVLDSAMYDSIVDKNYAKDGRLRVTGARSKHRKALSKEEYADILNRIGDLKNPADRRFLALIAYTGMRREEAFGLRWKDIDFHKKTMHIETSITFKGNRGIEGITKTDSGTRDFPIPLRLLDILQQPHESTEFVVKDGVTSSYAKRMWERIGREIDLHGATPHCFRHTWTTFAHIQGVDDKTLQSLGGWCDIATMREVYTHTFDEMRRNAIDKMDGFFVLLQQ